MDARGRNTMSDASRKAKRALDLVIAGLAAAIAGPFMLVIALAIRLEDRGPALLRQSRVGMDGEDFDLLKFRTMIADAHTVGSGWLVAERDPRITAWVASSGSGRWTSCPRCSTCCGAR